MGKTIKSVFWSAVEQYASLGIGMIFSFIIARQLLPSDYGAIAMLAIFMSISQCFIDSGFSSALIQKQNRTAKDLSTVFYYNLIIGVITYILLYFFSPLIASFYNQPLLIDLIPYVGLNLLIRSLTAVQLTIIQIELKFKRIAIITLVATLFSGFVAIYLAANGYGVWTLVYQALVSSSTTTLLLWITSSWKPQLLFSFSSFKELFGYGSRLLGGSLLHTIYLNLYSLVIGKVFNSKSLGLYNRANTWAAYPSSTLTAILSKSLFPILCQAQKNDKELIDRFFLYLRCIALIIFPCMLCMAAIADQLIVIVLTDKWIEVVPYFRLLCIGLMFEPLQHVIWMMLNVKHRTDLSLKSEIIKKIIGAVLLIVSLPFGLYVVCISILLYSIIDMLIVSYYVNKILITINFLKIAKILAPILLYSILLSLFAYIVAHFFSNIFYAVIIACITSLFFYILILIFTGDYKIIKKHIYGK